jgi:hypothetical protein
MSKRFSGKGFTGWRVMQGRSTHDITYLGISTGVRFISPGLFWGYRVITH